MNKKVIIVDDEPDVRTYLATLLEDNDYESFSASSSEEGFKFAKKEHPDLICLDIMMPSESGISLYKKLKSDEECKEIPVLLISAITRERDFVLEDYSLDSTLPEPVGFLEKPINPSTFLDKIKSIIG
jgi:twitching motility two-component system response regulator PilH